MASISKFVKAKDVIQAYFSTLDKRVYSYKEISDIFYQNKPNWNLPDKMYARDFVEQLEKHLSLTKFEITSVGTQHYTRDHLVKYVFGEISPFEVALCIRAKTHLSHFSSMFMLELTEQLPRTIYVTFEQTEKPEKSNSINQSSIDAAFSKPQREPSHYYEYLDYKIIMLNSKFTKKAGVIKHNSIYGKNLPIAGLERTIIDITVRPSYSGGVTEVLKAYERAAKALSINKIIMLLDKLNYVYPYHQSIGFYMETTNKYRQTQLSLLNEKDKLFDFYLTYNIAKKAYSKEWRLYYPKNF